MMRNLSRVAACLSVTSVLAGPGCGSSQLTSVTIAPPVADAQNFPGARVPFTATGTFSDSSKPVPLQNLTWCVGMSNGMCNGNIASPATVDSHGVARCTGGLNGTVTILAGTGNAMMNPDGGQQLAVFGTARLTCP